MNYKLFYGQLISTAESRPGVVYQRTFATEAEAKAYVMGCEDGVDASDPDNDDIYATISDTPAEDE